MDRERGIVFAFAFFDHGNIDWTWQLGELFKIEKGKIRRIEAMFHARRLRHELGLEHLPADM